MAIEYTGFDASQITESQWSVYNDIDVDLGRIGQTVTAIAGDRTVEVAAGSTRIKGVLCTITGTETRQATANASGNPRIDTLIWRIDWGADTAALAIKAGTPAANPIAATLTQQINNLWEEPIAYLTVAAGQGAFTADDIETVPPAVSARYGWTHVSAGSSSGVQNFTIPVPVHFRTLRLRLRGDLVSTGTIRLRINDDAGLAHRTALLVRDANGTLDQNQYREAGTAWYIAFWGTAAGCLAEVELENFTSSLISYRGSGTSNSSSATSHRESTSWGRLNSQTKIHSLNVRAFDEANGGVLMTACTWVLDGYRLP